MNDFSKELFGLVRELLKARFAFCFWVALLLAYLTRDRPELGDTYRGAIPIIAFLGVLFFLIWAVQTGFLIKDHCQAKTTAKNHKNARKSLLQRLNAQETYVLAKQLAKGQDTGDFIFSEYRAAIQSLDAKGLVKGHNMGGPSRVAVTILPEIWQLLEADKDAFIARSNSLNSDKPL